MPRFAYSLLLYLLTPLILLRLFWRGRKQPEYRQNIGERFGFYGQQGKNPEKQPTIWLHAVSVGETRAAQPLIDALQARWPSHRILLTGMTPTGRATGHEVYGDRVIQAYLPYDLPGAVDRFFRHFSPDFGVLMETEIWPNLLASAQRRNIPVLLVNARLSARSAKSYGRIAALVRPAFAALTSVAAQTAADAERLGALGARTVEVCGNLKFDVLPPSERLALGQTWRSAIGNRPVWLAASTREGEEALILDAWRRHGGPSCLLVLVPRHPQRFADVAALLETQQFKYVRRSQGLPDNATQVWLGDSMGEMAAYYTMADLAFIGGSLLALGGQNLIEAAACHCPVLVGPHTFNFLRATEDAIAAGAALRVSDPDALIVAVDRLLNAKSRSTKELAAMQQAAIEFATAHRGATRRTLSLIERDSGMNSAPNPAQPAGH
nr:lipid IV(A) 3-deoxy-D-manno-octulosonic acid transferase [Azonexus sp.]